MASKTFVANGKKVTVRSVNAERPTGLMSVGWTDPGPDINITIDGVKYSRTGHLMCTRFGTFAISISSECPGIKNYNSLNKTDTAPHPPFAYKTEAFAFKHLCDYIKTQLEGKPFIP